VGEPTGSMVVDIGGGTPRCGDLARRHRGLQSIRVGGDEMDEDHQPYAKKEYKLLIVSRRLRS